MYGTLINISISLRSTYLIGSVKGWWEIEQKMTPLNDWTQYVVTADKESVGDTDNPTECGCSKSCDC